METKTVDLAALDLLCEKLERDDVKHRSIAEQIRKAVKNAKPQLPEGIEWPRFEDGELVKFGDVARVREDIGEVIEVRFHSGKCSEVTIAFEGESTATHYMVVDGPHLKRHEPEVLDADGVPIKVGDTVYTLQGKAHVVSRLDAPYVYHKEGFTRADYVTHRKPDTLGDIERWLTHNSTQECYTDQVMYHIDGEVLQEAFARVRKLMGGE